MGSGSFGERIWGMGLPSPPLKFDLELRGAQKKLIGVM